MTLNAPARISIRAPKRTSRSTRVRAIAIRLSGLSDWLAEGGAQALLVLLGERGLDDLAAVLAHAVHELVARVGLAERDQRGAAGRKVRTELLEEVVVGADVGELAGDRTARGPDRHAEQWCQEQQADQAAPQRAAGRTRAGRADRLVELDLAV